MEKNHLALSANNILYALISTKLIIKMVCVLIIWLHLRVGISRSAANTILQAIQFTSSTMIQLIEVALSSHGIFIKLPNSNFPLIFVQHMGKNILSQISSGLLVAHLALLSTQPQLLWSVHGRGLQDPVPALQTLGNLRIHPEDQNWSPDSSTLHSLLIPGFVFFLSCQIIEDALDESFWQHKNSTAALGRDMHDVHDSLAWQDLTGLFSTARHLVIELYIDWFNPFTNKIAGMSEIFQCYFIYIDFILSK